MDSSKMYRLEPYLEINMPNIPSAVMYACEPFYKNLDVGHQTGLLPSSSKLSAPPVVSNSVPKSTKSKGQQKSSAQDNPSVTDFEKRQLDLLNKLHQLNTRLNNLGKSDKKRGSEQANNVKRQKTESISEPPDVPIPKPLLSKDGNFATYDTKGGPKADFTKHSPLNIIINSNSQPPLLLFVLARLLRERTAPTVRIGIRSFFHSSTGDIDQFAGKAKRQLDFINMANDGDIGACDFMVNFIWKKDSFMKEPILLHGACVESRTAKIVGEIAIAKFMASLVNFYPVVGTSPQAAFLTLDYWLYTANAFAKPAYREVRHNVLKEMNNALSKRPFLIGDRLTLADLVVWSVLNQSGYYLSRPWNTLPENVQKWYMDLNSIKTFQPALAWIL